MAVASEGTGMEALNRLKSTEPPVWLVPSESLSEAARTASQHLFSRLKPHVPKSPFDHLLVDGFDSEQIWQQIDLQSQPLLSTLRRQVKQWERNPEEIRTLLTNVLEGSKKVTDEKKAKRVDEVDNEEDVEMDEFDDDDEEEEEEEDGEERESGDEEMEEKGEGGVEDKFLKIKELEEYLEEDEAREYGLDRKKKKGKQSNINNEEDGDEDEEEEGEENEEDDELGIYDEEDEEADKLGNVRYEDFFDAKKEVGTKRKTKLPDEFEEESESGDEQGNDAADEKQGSLSTHEKELQKRQLEIEQMEKENLAEKVWTMQGEVTAANRPKNSALEVDLDFEHNVRPAPVITEEVTASLEDIIKNRIIEERFDDIQKVSRLPSKGPRELKELDDNKSKKGLADVYEDEYVKTTTPAFAPSSFTDEHKKEASILFKKLCLKLDALSHFNFAPKPVIEEMSIQTNVPALAMEEIAPVAVSDAAMLAPEEVYSGKGDIKEEVELTQADRKRRRANKKRKFKAEAAKRKPKKARDDTLLDQTDDKEK